MGLFGGGRAVRAMPVGEPPIPGPGSVGPAPQIVGNRVRRSEHALRRIAVFASVNLIAGVTSSLPIGGFTGTGSTRRPVPLPPFFTDPDGSGQGFGDWLYQVLWSWCLRGNAYGEIVEVDGVGRPARIVLQHPDLVSQSPVLQPDGTYRVQWWFGGRQVDRDRVWHRRMFPVPGHPLGLSPIALHASTIGLGLSAEAFGARWFEDGGHPSAILQNEQSQIVSQEQANTVKQRFLQSIRGTREPVVLGAGWKYQAVQIAPNESQFLDTQKYTAAECARIFGPGMPEILGYETGGSLTYTNVEQRSLDLLKYTLNRYFTRVEDVLSTDVLARPRFLKLNRGALLETDLLTRYRAHELALRNRFTVVNEVRELEDMTPVPWGDEPNPATAPTPTPTTGAP